VGLVTSSLAPFDSELKEAPEFKEFDQPISGVAGKNAIEKTNNFGQAGEIYRSYDESTKQALIKNLLDQFFGIENRTSNCQPSPCR
jgi:catalase